MQETQKLSEKKQERSEMEGHPLTTRFSLLPGTISMPTTATGVLAASVGGLRCLPFVPVWIFNATDTWLERRIMNLETLKTKSIPGPMEDACHFSETTQQHDQCRYSGTR